MNREQMIDLAVRRSIKRSTMAGVLGRAEIWERANADPLAWRGSPGWFKEDAPFRFYPRRLEAIRKEFHRIAAEQGA